MEKKQIKTSGIFPISLLIWTLASMASLLPITATAADVDVDVDVEQTEKRPSEQLDNTFLFQIPIGDTKPFDADVAQSKYDTPTPEEDGLGDLDDEVPVKDAICFLLLMTLIYGVYKFLYNTKRIVFDRKG